MVSAVAEAAGAAAAAMVVVVAVVVPLLRLLLVLLLLNLEASAVPSTEITLRFRRIATSSRTTCL